MISHLPSESANTESSSIPGRTLESAANSGCSWLNYWRLSWIVFVLAIPLRLYFFSGYGVLADDVNDVYLAVRIIFEGGLDPETSHHYRLLTVLPRALCFYLFGVSPFTFILPILFYSLGTHALCLLLTRDVLGSRAALITSLLFFSTPFETLASTTSVPDYGTGFFSLLLAWLAVRGIACQSRARMVLAALAGVLAVLNKISGAGVLVVAAVATVSCLRHWRLWLFFWVSSLILFLIVCLGDYFHSGYLLRWLWYNNWFDGEEVSSRLLEIWAIFPRYLFYRDDFNNWMFGFSGLLGASGALLAIVQLARGRANCACYLVCLSWFVYLSLTEFMPHKITLDGYYSHWRVYRYLGGIVAAVYFSAAYAFESALIASSKKKLFRYFVWSLLGIVVGFNLLQTPEVSRPAWDSARDGKELLKFFQTYSLPHGATVHSNQWKCDWIRTMWRERTHDLQLQCYGNYPQSNGERNALFASIEQGYVITGGAGLGWYGSLNYILNLSDAEFTPPDNWDLLLEVPGEQAAWRREPLRLWLVRTAAIDQTIVNSAGDAIGKVGLVK